MTSGSKKCRKEPPIRAEIIRNKRIRYLPFLSETDILFLLPRKASNISIVVPSGQAKPQKKRPKISVAKIKKIDNQAVAMIVR